MTAAQMAADPPARGDVILRLGAQLAGVVEIRSALSAVAPQIAEIVSYTHADICLHDSPGWVVSYEVGIETRWSRKRTRVQYSPVRELLTGRTDLMLTANAMTDPRYTYPGACCEPILNHRLRSRINVPMVVMGRVIGTLNVSHNIEGLYGMAQVEAVRELSQVLSPHFHALHAAEKAQQAARARARAQEQADGLRRGALELTQALEQERQRIGMDLHDQTLADLTRILRDLTSEAPLDRDLLAERVTDTIDDLRRLIDMAVPTLLDLFGFAHAVRVHLERAVGSDPVTIDVEDATEGAPDRLNPTARTALYRIAQEAINNAARHARATHIVVSITRDAAARLRVIIRDDGCGIGADGGGRHSGLAHLRTRAHLVGADLEIVADGGTCVTVTLPAGAEGTA
jgi:signal transduction histidine kinase